MTNLLIFKIDDSFFGVEIDNVKWIVDIEKVFDVVMMPPYVVGEIKHNESFYFLVCLKKLLKLNECDDFEDKSAIIYAANGKEFALLVDEIVQINEIEDKSNYSDKVAFYANGNEVVEVLKEEFFNETIEVPAIKPDQNREKDMILSRYEHKINRDEHSFLLFKLNNEKFAIDVSKINYVEVFDDAKKGVYVPKEKYIAGIYQIKKRLINLIDLKKLLNIEGALGENIFILKKDNSYLGLAVDEVLNIVTISENEINSLKDDKDIIKEFFLLKDETISIINENFLNTLMDKHAIVSKKESYQKEELLSTLKKELKEFLIVKIGSKHFAIMMERVKEISEEEDVHLTRSFEDNKYIEGIAALDSRSYILFNISKLLGEESKDATQKMLLVLEAAYNDNNYEFTMFVDDIVDIVQVPKEQVYFLTMEERYFLKGTVSFQNNIYHIINTAWLIKHIKENG